MLMRVHRALSDKGVLPAAAAEHIGEQGRIC